MDYTGPSQPNRSNPTEHAPTGARVEKGLRPLPSSEKGEECELNLQAPAKVVTDAFLGHKGLYAEPGLISFLYFLSPYLALEAERSGRK